MRVACLMDALPQCLAEFHLLALCLKCQNIEQHVRHLDAVSFSPGEAKDGPVLFNQPAMPFTE